MAKKAVLVGILIVGAILVVFSAMAHLDYSNKTKHETGRWAVIMDSKEDIIAIETADPEFGDTLKNLHENQTEMWIGGIIEEWDNHWGFRFNPDTIVIAQITVEGGQSNIQAINEDLDYWMNTWQKQVYVLARVTEIHE